MTGEGSSDLPTAVMFVNQGLLYDPETGEYSSNYMNLIDFLLEASSEFESLTLCLPVDEGTGQTEFSLPENVDIEHLPHYHGPGELVRTLHRVGPRLVSVARSAVVRDADIVGIVVPSTLSAAVAPLTRYRYGKPHFLLMRGDKRKTITQRFSDDPVRSTLFKTPIKLYDRLFGSMSHTDDATLFTIGDLRKQVEPYGYDPTSAVVLKPLISTDLVVDTPRVAAEATELLYVGRLADEKGIDNLLRAVARLDSREMDIHLNIVGSGPANESLRELASELGVMDTVTFHGFVPKGPELWKQFDEADLFVLPSHTEGLPRVVAEAMARGLPVVTTAVGGLPELVDDGENGFLVEPGDVDGLVEAIVEVCSDEGLRERVARTALETAESLTFEAEAETLGRATRSLLE